MKVTRAAFIYLEPKGRDDKGVFAQCWSCRMYVPEVSGRDGGRCVIHGSEVDIDADDSCGFWVDWPTPDGEPNPEVVADHARELAKGIPGSVKPVESGLVDERVQCRHCEFAEAEAEHCGLYAKLNRRLGSEFDADPKIKPHACCNAWVKRAPAPSERRYERKAA